MGNEEAPSALADKGCGAVNDEDFEGWEDAGSEGFYCWRSLMRNQTWEVVERLSGGEHSSETCVASRSIHLER